MASPILYARFEPRLYERVVAAEAESVSLSALLRMAVSEHLGAIEQEAAERATLLAEARSYLATGPRSTDVDLAMIGLVSRYVAAIEATAGRLSAAERRGRARALQEIAEGALEPLDGEELTFPEFHPDSPPVGLETTTPRRQGFLREALARERAVALLQAPPPPSPLPSAAGLLGEQRTRAVEPGDLLAGLAPGLLPLARDRAVRPEHGGHPVLLGLPARWWRRSGGGLTWPS